MANTEKWRHADVEDEKTAKIVALVAASTTDSPAAEVAKQLYLDELQDDLDVQIESLEVGNDFGQTNYSIN